MANPTPSEQPANAGSRDDLPADAELVKRTWALRGNCFGAIVMLLVQYGLGMWVNLYGHLPASDHGANIATGFARAVSKGPVGLSIHAILGVLLILSATAALVRAVQLGRAVFIGAALVGLLSIAAAGFSGARFVGSMNNSASITMAIGAGIAIGAYALILLLPPQQIVTPRPSPPASAQTESGGLITSE
ncbi:MAG TPA: hypothetical protein VGJ79_04970 [Candidatus Dormibacteraeota bacterium]|jgi:hypothetical protein